VPEGKGKSLHPSPRGVFVRPGEGVLGKPGKVSAVGDGQILKIGDELDWLSGIGINPLMHFGVAIYERYAATTAMETAWDFSK
jgi:hypothetical protein